MDAIRLLENDHNEMKQLLEEVEGTGDGAIEKREKLYGQIRQELRIHEKIEEEIFYPALKDHPKAKDVVLEGYEEHHAVDVLLDELEGIPFDDETWGPKMTVIKENVEHHIEEEEGEMFPKAKEIFHDDELAHLGEQMNKLKQQESS